MGKQLGLFMEECTSSNSVEKMKTDMYSYTLNRDTILIYLLSKMYGYNINILHLLYEKYDKDLFYFFYMQPIKKGNIPTYSRIAYLIKSSNSIYQEIINRGKIVDFELDFQGSKDILKELNNIVDVDNMIMSIDLGMSYDLDD